MRRPFTLNRETFLQVINKEIQLFNERFVENTDDEMYYLSDEMDLTAVSRAITDFDYLVHSYDSLDDELLEKYLYIRELLVGLRITIYSEMFMVKNVWEEDS